MFLFLSILIILIHQTNAQPGFLYNFCLNDKGNYTANSNYHNNLNTLLSNLSTNTQIDYGFYNFSYGLGNDKVNAIGLCRGDVKPDNCRSCLNDSRVLLTQLCPNQKEAIGWYDNCMLRYSNRSIFSTMESSPTFYMSNRGNATNVDQFNTVLTNLLNSLLSQASLGDSRRKFAIGNVTGPGFQTIFGLVQCTPDLSEQECSDCLVGAISQIPQCCDNKKGGRVVTASCNIRYEIYRFYELANVATSSPPPKVLPLPPSPTGNSSNSRTVLVIAIVVPIVAFVILVIIICICLRMRKSRKHIEDEAQNDDEIQSSETLQLDFATIMVATNNFSDANKLGQGGFGPVYKGTLSDGQEVAVKRLSVNSSQGDIEFKNEVLLVAKLQHRNLVKLQGFCLERKERLLVYEFVPNKSLDFFIFDQVKRAHLDWERRYKIIGGIARGLVYLHEDSRLRIIHRDLKASNILLDEVMNPKISDFGMARLFATDQTQGNTSRVVGTYGYMAPEYMLYGQFSVKSDVFSFGVLVLEIVSGTKNSGVHRGENVEDLVTYAWRNWREGTASNIVDPTLTDGSRNEIMRCMHIGLLCVQENIAERPSMASVLLMLNSYSVTLPLPSQPASFTNRRTLSTNPIHSEEYNSGATKSSSESQFQSVQASVNEASITEPFPR
ncbi:hypothetical protein Lal_00000463 [Lupinus albus]|uniref:Uncharacterized protein n=1 Tax=Lupinus albus TaxID=3870 RepID=A0A6A5LIB3_LUPAL|nr:putative protein kinase RLK-Pelle-DLSV family [Lupinus albus]KAF1861046.1 hypothetical protein Lal_00000463 [Lupinus albus]